MRNNGNKFYRLACCLVAGGFLATAPLASHAEDNSIAIHEISVGVLDHDTDSLWSGFSRESGIDVNAEVLFSSVGGFLGGQVHPALGASFNTGGDTSKAYAGLRYRYETEGGLFFGLGLGAAVHNGETDLVANDKKALGSKVLFHIPIEAGYRFSDHYALSVYFDHVSNAYLADKNEGMDTLGIRLGYKF